MIATNLGATAAFNFLGGILTNVVIYGNKIDYANSSPNSSVVILADDINGLTIENNSIDAELASNQVTTLPSSKFTNIVNLTMDNNYDLSGNYLPDLNAPLPGRSGRQAIGPGSH